MNNENEKITGLTPEQMDNATGGGTGNGSTATASSVKCSLSPDGKHNWIYYKDHSVRRCSYCGKSEIL